MTCKLFARAIAGQAAHSFAKAGHERTLFQSIYERYCNASTNSLRAAEEWQCFKSIEAPLARSRDVGMLSLEFDKVHISGALPSAVLIYTANTDIEDEDQRHGWN
jgi:hypothetical protein